MGVKSRAPARAGEGTDRCPAPRADASGLLGWPACPPAPLGLGGYRRGWTGGHTAGGWTGGIQQRQLAHSMAMGIRVQRDMDKGEGQREGQRDEGRYRERQGSIARGIAGGYREG